jgi:hypothetical protein
MDIVSLLELKYNALSKKFNLYYPQLAFSKEGLATYIVQSGEEMRIDLVVMSIYDNPYALKDTDVILFLNGIDNPLNINVGDEIYYPELESLKSYRYYFDTASRAGEDVRKQLASPNKTAKPDPARRKFVENGYSLPPVVLDEAKPPVRLEGDKIVIGGLN